MNNAVENMQDALLLYRATPSEATAAALALACEILLNPGDPELLATMGVEHLKCVVAKRPIGHTCLHIVNAPICEVCA